MVAGGYYGSSLSSVEVLSSESSLTNKKLAEFPNHIYGQPSLLLHDDSLLLCGGYGNLNKCLVYENNYWKQHSILNEWRIYASAVMTAEGTYIFGGDGSKKTFEFLPTKAKIWQEGRTQIPDGFTTGCAVEVVDEQKILLIGGSGTRKRILKFDIETQAFEEMNVSLIEKRWGHTCAKLPHTNLILITGGLYSDTNGKSEIFDMKDNTIILGNPMNTKRSYHGMAVITIANEDRLTVFGGRDENLNRLDSVEIFNSSTRKWEIVSDLKLEEAKAAFGYVSLPYDVISNL